MLLFSLSQFLSRVSGVLRLRSVRGVLPPEAPSCPAFTLIELLVVIAILGLLAGFAVVDYGNAIKKARLEVAVERMIAVLEDVHVRAQNRLTMDSSEGEGEASEDSQVDTTLSCWGIGLEAQQEPLMVRAPLDEEKQCDFDGLETEQVVKWNQDVALTEVVLHFDNSSDTTEQVEQGPVWIFFTPPLGEADVYIGSDAILAKVFPIKAIDIGLSYGGSKEEVWSKALRFSPLTFKVVVSSSL